MRAASPRDPIGAPTPGGRQPVHRLTVEGRKCEVWGESPTTEPMSRHEICWTVTAPPLPGEVDRVGGYFSYPSAFIVPIQPLPGWPGVRAGLGHEPPFDEGWFVRAADSEYTVYGFARTPGEAWQIAAEALHREIATHLKGRK